MGKRRSLLWKLYPTYLLVILLCVGGVGGLALQFADVFYQRQVAVRLETTARLIADDLAECVPGLEPAKVQALCVKRGQATGLRVTVIPISGERFVLGDSEHNPEGMEEHASRPEVKDALAEQEQGLPNPKGVSVRRSPTLGMDTMYVAVPVRIGDGQRVVVRTAIRLKDVQGAIAAIWWRIGVAAAVITGLAAGIAMAVSRRIARPLKEMAKGAERFARGDLSHKVVVPETEEEARLAETLNRMAAELDQKIRTVTRQKSELEAGLASMVEGVLAVDRAGRVLNLNRAACEMFGVAREQAVGRGVQELVRDAELNRLVDRILADRQPVEGEIVLRRDGERILQVRGTVLREAAGRDIGAMVVLNDVTRLHRLAQVRRDFVANVSHELKTPITSIQGFVETLREGAIRDPEKAEQFLDIIGRQVDRLSAIIEDLLVLARIERDGEAGRIELQRADLATLLDETVEEYAERAAAAGVSVRVDCARPLWANVNPHLVAQAVGNLLDNAIKYSPSGEAVDLEARQDGTDVLIRVRDRGCGIAAEHLPRIFERFYCADKARSRNLGGTGLGLSIVKHIVQAHGGSVSVESTPGKGSTFTIRIPSA
jgi:two-component system phosphate regulon sensor histidine kinase PhoR